MTAGVGTVLCVRRAAVEAVAPLGGFRAGVARWERALSWPAAGGACQMLLRDDALEHDREWLQLVSYTVLWCDGRLHAYARGGGAGEGDPRLVRRWSVGVGGHVEPVDLRGPCRPGGLGPPMVATPLEAVRAAAMRELYEEVDHAALTVSDFRRVGLVFDDGDEVGAVHLGVVYQASYATTRARVRRSAGLPLGWRTADEWLAAGEHPAWENWSRHVLADYARPLPDDVPAGAPRPGDGNLVRGS